MSPQFHCVYDDQFDSVKNDSNFSTVWAEKAGLSQMEDDNSDDYLKVRISPQLSIPFVDNVEPIEDDQGRDLSHLVPVDQDDSQVEVATNEENEGANEEPPTQREIPQEQPAAPAVNQQVERNGQPNQTRSGRTIRRTQRLEESPLLPTLRSFVSMVKHRVAEGIEMVAYPASIADNDTMYLKQAMQQPDRDKFLEAMIKEIEDHTKRGHWRITSKEEMRQKGYSHRPIMAVWSFKRKRDPFGRITKYKARLCCHGGQTIKGVHYEETFSPVVAWSTVRMMLTLAIINGWHARQIDFVLAFPQAKVRTDIYMNVPDKFEVRNGKLELNESALPPQKQDNVVKLIQNVYGLADASYTWHEHAKKGLRQCGFVQSKVDPCLFYKGEVLFILYVDDAVCLSKNKEEGDKLIKELQQLGYVLTDEGSLSAYLGIQIERKGNAVMMTQPAFVKRCVDSVQLKDNRMHDTPAEVILRRDNDGPPRKTNFHYRSVIGQMNYLAATTRPDIQFAVHQCARFCEDPKMSHEKAVKRVARYLRKTQDKGLSMKVDKRKGIECFVDADFAGAFDKEKPTNPRDCMSRTGYLIKFANCPIIWSSKLQTMIALSTTEAEYMALSSAMREVIFLMNLLEELRKNGVELLDKQPLIKCNVFEDNVGAIELAKLPKLRPRTKHIAIQYHHFREWTTRMGDQEPRVLVQHIKTEYQQADMLTKPLPRVQFQKLRELACGW